MNPILIEVATPEDAAAIRHIQNVVWIDTYPNEELGITVEAIKERIAKYITPEFITSLQESMKDPSQRTWLAKDAKIIGYCTAKKKENLNQVEAIYLLPEYHGKEVGKRLIEAALEWLGNDKDILIEVASYNGRAIRFYEKYGFKKNGVIGNSGEIPTIQLVRITL